MESWACMHCTFLNEMATCTECGVCGLPRDVQPDSLDGIRSDLLEETQCPIPSCQAFLDADFLEEHLQMHRLAGDDVETARVTMRLRRRYGLDADPGNATYEDQFSNRLAAQVSRGKVTPAQAEEQIARMHAEVQAGVDNAAVHGIIPHVHAVLDSLHRPRRKRGNPNAIDENMMQGGKAGQLCAHAGTSRGSSWVTCGSGVVHCHGDYGDSGWGCGYRNIQITCGFLLQCGPPLEEAYHKVLFGGCGVLPTIPKLQEWIEQAWASGFDTAGAEQLEGTLVQSKKLIGAMECAALLRSFGVRAHTVTFNSPAVPPRELEERRRQARLDADRDNASHPARKKPKQPRFVPSHDPCIELADFCWHYFVVRQPHFTNSGQQRPLAVEHSEEVMVGHSGEVMVDSLVEPFCPPLYLQHDGHSRTIVGAERDSQNGRITSLLIFDPSTDSSELLADVRDRRRLQKVRRSVETFTQPRYQLCIISPGIADAQERELMKTIQEISAQEALWIPST
mmetsp:Transcript_15366/g.27431  ORF Transcript_15366/g.27431 Transcript_15366/m.27431 type:complete len:508 (-) Transcript_15366:83-1606(-)